MFRNELGMECLFEPMLEIPTIMDDLSSSHTYFGLGILTNLPIIGHRADWYDGDKRTVPAFSRDPITGSIITNKLLLSAEISYNGVAYTFANTHFTWSNDGAVTDRQRESLKKLLEILNTLPEFVLAGDFNAPRGREIFTAIAEKYRDNIPLNYLTSIDKNLHRAGDLGLMVDGLFSTPEYEITDVKLSDGVSDHMAVTALIAKKV